jgi:tyrosyl-tRNA synthetase
MSISDELMWKYYTLLTDLAPADLAGLQEQVKAGTVHPKQAKVDLAAAIVGDFHGKAEAARAAAGFERRFAKGEIDSSTLDIVGIATGPDGSKRLASIIVEAGLASSSSEAQRKIQQGGVKVDQQKITDVRARCDTTRPSFVLEVGRRAVRIEMRS